MCVNMRQATCSYRREGGEGGGPKAEDTHAERDRAQSSTESSREVPQKARRSHSHTRGADLRTNHGRKVQTKSETGGPLLTPHRREGTRARSVRALQHFLGRFSFPHELSFGKLAGAESDHHPRADRCACCATATAPPRVSCHSRRSDCSRWLTNERAPLPTPTPAWGVEIRFGERAPTRVLARQFRASEF